MTSTIEALSNLDRRWRNPLAVSVSAMSNAPTSSPDATNPPPRSSPRPSPSQSAHAPDLLAEVISLAATRARLAGDEDAVAPLLELAGGVIGTPYPGERARVTANWHTSWDPWHHNRLHRPAGEHITQARHLAHLDNVRRAAAAIIAAPPRPPTENPFTNQRSR